MYVCHLEGEGGREEGEEGREETRGEGGRRRVGRKQGVREGGGG